MSLVSSIIDDHWNTIGEPWKDKKSCFPNTTPLFTELSSLYTSSLNEYLFRMGKTSSEKEYTYYIGAPGCKKDDVKITHEEDGDKNFHSLNVKRDSNIRTEGHEGSVSISSELVLVLDKDVDVSQDITAKVTDGMICITVSRKSSKRKASSNIKIE
jgi:HSP20 family molecular chaperone IbpA